MLSLASKSKIVILSLTGALMLASATPAQVNAKPLGAASEQDLPNSLADLIEHVSPAVVNIRVVTGGYAVDRPREDATEGQGSGFIVTPDGKLVTNYHVIKDGDKITVDFANGTEFPAKIIGTDRETDLAVLQIQPKKAGTVFEYVSFHQGSDSRIGDWVLAIGNPFGIGQSSSVGIISAISRDRVESGSFVDYLQTDATVNRGNSGGPLCNFQGRVVGVNSSIYSPTGASVGIAFAIPYYLAQDITADLIKYGKVRRGFLGVSIREAEYTQNGIVYKAGATITAIGAGSPADRAGLQVEDIILKVNNLKVNNGTEATRAIARLRAGERAVFEIERDSRTIDGGVRVTLGERPSDKAKLEAATGNSSRSTASNIAAPPTPKAKDMYNTGLSLVDLSATFRESIGMRMDQVGVYVDQVAPGSNAARKGIKSGMVILEAYAKPIVSVRAFRETLRKAKASGRRSVVVSVRTINGSETYTSISLN